MFDGIVLPIIRDRVRQILNANVFTVSADPRASAYCEMMPNGQPLPTMGNVFVAIHPADVTVTSTGGGTGAETDYSFAITLTQRTAREPYQDDLDAMIDRDGQTMQKIIFHTVRGLLNWEGIHSQFTTVVDGLSLNADIVSAITGPVSFETPVEASQDWFRVEDPRAGSSIMGYYRRATFAGIKIMHAIGCNIEELS